MQIPVSLSSGSWVGRLFFDFLNINSYFELEEVNMTQSFAQLTFIAFVEAGDVKTSFLSLPAIKG